MDIRTKKSGMRRNDLRYQLLNITDGPWFEFNMYHVGGYLPYTDCIGLDDIGQTLLSHTDSHIPEYLLPGLMISRSYCQIYREGNT